MPCPGGATGPALRARAKRHVTGLMRRPFPTSRDTSVHATLYRVVDRELRHLLDTVLAGDVGADRETTELLARTVGALVRLHAQHPVDAHGQGPPAARHTRGCGGGGVGRCARCTSC